MIYNNRIIEARHFVHYEIIDHGDKNERRGIIGDFVSEIFMEMYKCDNGKRENRDYAVNIRNVRRKCR